MAKKQVAKPVEASRDALLARFKDYPAIDILSRRFNDPNDPGSVPILLKDEDRDACVNTDHQNRIRPAATTCHLCKKPVRLWYVRFINTTQEGRWAQIRAKGYVPVETTELNDLEDVADLVKSGNDRYVRRGDRGQEILVKMPLELYIEIKKRQRDLRKKNSLSSKKLQSDLAEAAGEQLGDEAGQTLHDGGIKVESLRATRSTLAEEVEALVE